MLRRDTCVPGSMRNLHCWNTFISLQYRALQERRRFPSFLVGFRWHEVISKLQRFFFPTSWDPFIKIGGLNRRSCAISILQRSEPRPDPRSSASQCLLNSVLVADDWDAISSVVTGTGLTSLVVFYRASQCSQPSISTAKWWPPYDIRQDKQTLDQNQTQAQGSGSKIDWQWKYGHRPGVV